MPRLPPAAPAGLEVVEAREAVAAVPSSHVRQAGALASHGVAGRLLADRTPRVAVAGWGWEGYRWSLSCSGSPAEAPGQPLPLREELVFSTDP